MEIEFINEFSIGPERSGAIIGLLKTCFGETEYPNRTYFKQLPHSRILAHANDTLVGHLGIDFRVMSSNGNPITVFGLIDFCVAPDHRKKGIGTKLLNEFEAVAKRNASRVDFLLLVTENTAYYEKRGYRKTAVETKWLKINEHQTYGEGEEKIDDAFIMIKPISDKAWQDGKLNLLGYMY